MANVSLEPNDYLHRFGISEFRPGQRDVVEAVLSGHDCLCIMPTGGGKSLCYQLPSLMREGVTLVVSPLIALMKDQVDTLVQRGISASFINSTLDSADQSMRLDQLAAGEFDLMYVAPERFRSPRFQEALVQAKVQLLAVDEAHCISEWGHDFRHDYAKLGTFRKKIGSPQTIALTATATDDVRKDVVVQLDLNEPKTFIAGFARPNLQYAVQTHASFRDKIEALQSFLKENEGCGVIYASTRKGCEEIAESVGMPLGRKVVVYHAGLAMDDRRKVQDAFMSGKADIVVATNAFGMGIDKPDVRFVVHYNIPGTLEAYYQEAGRAGRDGKPSQCLLLYSPSDRYIQEFFIDSANPAPETIHAVYEFLRYHEGDPIELTQEELKEEANLSIGSDGVGTCERVLEKCGVLERLEPNRNMAAVRLSTDIPTIADLIPPQAKNRRKVAKAIESVVGPRRHELVYFRPPDLARMIGMDIVKFTRSLREITSKLECVDYVPPFRGRAVRMIRRDLEFDQLDIDFTEIEARRKLNFGKLDRVVKFATTSQCRQQQVLDYFGEKSSDPCGNCDNCTRFGLKQESSERNSKKLDEAVLKVLSGVARARGRFGKTIVAQMLSGSQSVKMTRYGLKTLSTFGILSHLRQAEVIKLIDATINSGLVELSEADRFRPVVSLTGRGSEVMRQRVPVPVISLPQELAGRFGGRRKDVTLDQPGDLTETLQGSKAEDPQPDNFHIVDAPEHAEPDQESQARVVSDDLGQVANPDVDCDDRPDETNFGTNIRIDQPSTSVAKSERVDGDAMVSSESRPTHYWTWRLLSNGFSVNECTAIRNIDRAEILAHIDRCADDGLRIELDWVFDLTQLTSIQTEYDRDEARGISTLKQRLQGRFSLQELQLFVKCRTRAESTQQ